jgi:hypothetical protein
MQTCHRSVIEPLYLGQAYPSLDGELAVLVSTDFVDVLEVGKVQKPDGEFCKAAALADVKVVRDSWILVHVRWNVVADLQARS